MINDEMTRLVERLKSQIGDDVRDAYDLDVLCRDAANAIQDLSVRVNELELLVRDAERALPHDLRTFRGLRNRICTVLSEK